MTDDSLQENKVQSEGDTPRTLKEFVRDVTALVERHGKHPEVFVRHLNDWKSSGYDAKMLSQNILAILVHQRNELNNRQIRCDASIEQLQRSLVAIRDHTLEGHIEDTILARQLVEWCETYISGVRPQP